MHPPPIAGCPWNSGVVKLGDTKDTVVDGVVLAKALWPSFGFAGLTPPVDFRVLKIRVWVLASARPVRLSVFGWDNTKIATGGAITVLEAWPGRMEFPAIGYEVSAAYSQIVWSSDSTSQLFAIDVAAANAWLCYVDVLWRGNSYSPVTESVMFRAYRDAAASEDDLGLRGNEARGLSSTSSSLVEVEREMASLELCP